MGIEDKGKEIGGGKDANDTMDVWSYKAWQNQKLINKGDNKSGRNLKESQGKEAEVVWACVAKRRALRRNEDDGNRSTKEEEDRKA